MFSLLIFEVAVVRKLNKKIFFSLICLFAFVSLIMAFFSIINFCGRTHTSPLWSCYRWSLKTQCMIEFYLLRLLWRK